MRHGRHEFRLQVSRLQVSRSSTSGKGLDPVSKKCVGWSIVCFLAGSIMQWSLFPTGAALIGASVVIQWFRSNLAVMPKKSQNP